MLKMRTVFYCWVMSIAAVIFLSKLDRSVLGEWKPVADVLIVFSGFLIWYFLASMMFSFGAIIGIFKAAPKDHWEVNYGAFYVFFTKEARRKVKLDISRMRQIDGTSEKAAS